ncbi:MAG: hypothetical protein LUQ25_04560 [Methanoregulaceae archaeon]|nr:hypothetical protein [Methanoregulaceae archaeon]
MDEGGILRMVSAQLAVIEQVWEVRFQNREDVCRWVAGIVHDEKQVLTVTSALNNWVAVSAITGQVEMKRVDFEQIARTLRW